MFSWWAAVEDGLSIIAASIPTLRPLLAEIFPRSTIDEGSGRSNSKRSYGTPASNSAYINMQDLNQKGVTRTTVEARNRTYSEEGDERSDKGILKETTFFAG